MRSDELTSSTMAHEQGFELHWRTSLRISIWSTYRREDVNQKDQSRDIPLDSVDVLSAEGVEELKRKVKIKGEKKKPSLHLGRNRVNTSAVRITKMIAGNGYVKSGQKRSKTDKTRHENEKSSRNRSGRRIHLKSNPVNPLTVKKS
nr:hypothetical protein [Tanacetum cinerariifolium]